MGRGWLCGLQMLASNADLFDALLSLFDIEQ